MPPKPSLTQYCRLLALMTTSGIAAMALPAVAQELTTPAAPLPSADVPVPQSDEEIGFAADQLSYDETSQKVTASGNVQMVRQGNRLRADTVVWNRTTGKVDASGNVTIVNPEGDIAYGDAIEVTDSLKDGMVENMLLVLQRGGRLAAAQGTRKDGIYTLNRAAYTPCAVEDSKGCPKEPTWQITAVQVIYSPDLQRVKYKGARVELFGLPLIPLPGLSHPAGELGGSGFLVPDIRYDRVNGLEFSLPYYIKLAENRDITITPYLYSDAAPMVQANYRHLTGRGAYQVTGYATYGSRIPTSAAATALRQEGIRGYLDFSGKFQLTPEWSVTGSARIASDRTFLRRYDISRDDRLRSTVQAERITRNSYLSIAGWATQTLRTNDAQGQVPIALPVIDYRLRMEDPVLGGIVQFQANTLAISRTDGQDTQRAFAGAEWNLRRITSLGQELTLTGYLRGDVYHSGQNQLTNTVSYRGQKGWETRGIAAAAIDVRWPFIGEALGGTQRIAPRVQIVAAPKLKNLALPNEDARAVELEDSNLFALNRFPGYDRFEDSSRVTYGLEYQLDVPNVSVNANIGQSYRLDSRRNILPDGTGLAENVSDIVGRTTVRYKDFLSLSYRFRLDKDSLAVRRSEVDATVGTNRTYAKVGYLRLNRDITGVLEDLRDREEIRLAARVQFARYWSLFGSTVVDLTSRREDPLSIVDGYEPVRHRLGVAYADDCLDFSLTWRRDYQAQGDARSGNTFLLRLAFRNLGI